MNCPIPPEGLTKEIIEKEFGPLPKCEHGAIKALCSVCFAIAVASKNNN